MPTNSFNARTVYCAVELCPLIQSHCHIRRVVLVYQCCRSINCYVNINNVRGVRLKALPWTSLSSMCAAIQICAELTMVASDFQYIACEPTTFWQFFIVILTPKLNCTGTPPVSFASGTRREQGAIPLSQRRSATINYAET